jgi:hypothetical protein
MEVLDEPIHGKLPRWIVDIDDLIRIIRQRSRKLPHRPVRPSEAMKKDDDFLLGLCLHRRGSLTITSSGLCGS